MSQTSIPMTAPNKSTWGGTRKLDFFSWHIYCTQHENIYFLCGVDVDGKNLTVLTYYTDDDFVKPKSIGFNFGKKASYEVYLLDEAHNGELISTTEELNFTLKVNTCLLI